jgi:deoxyribodipyrimidine photo-lyase
MIVASFLTKDLHLNWQEGERHFAEALGDADIASNNGGWQWTAGTGTDASPWFRVFNPSLQGERFDPEGSYVRAYVPELRRVPARFVHTPWEMSADDQRSARCVVGRNYPGPIVDHAVERGVTLELYRHPGGAATKGPV